MSIDEQAALVTPELLERVAEALYEALDPHFREFAWKDALEGQQEWARGRARHVAPIVVEQGFLLAQKWTRGMMERNEDVHT